MKKLLLLSFTLCFFTSFLYAQEPTFGWAKRIGGPSDENSKSLALDAFRNVYTAGHFNGTIDFDPGPGTFNLTPAGSHDIFVSKLDAAGNFVWAKRIGGIADDVSASCLTVDASGNVYLVGTFSSTVDFDPGPGVFNLTASSGLDFFILKLDAAGNFVWAKKPEGSSAFRLALSITVDALSNLYITGYFENTSDFDPGPGIFNLTAEPGTADSFILKLDAAGNFVWAKKLGGADLDIGISIAVDAVSNVYVTGYFFSTADFDPGPGIFNLTSAGIDDMFILKLDAAGNFVWAKGMGGTNTDFPFSIKVDVAGNVYTTGYFVGTSDFDPGPGTFHLTAIRRDIFILKLDAAGNLAWARNIGGNGVADEGRSITVDASGNVYTTGIFEGTVDFNPGAGTYNLTSVGYDVFVSKLDAAGAFLWARNLQGTADDIPSSIEVDVAGNIYITGEFRASADFDPTLGTYPLTSAGSWDIFVFKWEQLQGPPIGGNACPHDTLITLTSCTGTANVVWPVPKDSFPSSISIPAGFYPDGRPYDGEGRLTLLSTFDGHGYYRSTDAYQSYSWEVANQIALSIGGHLTTITSEAENAFITSRVQSTGYFSWLGLKRTGAGPTQFSWVTGEPLGYTNWGAEDPNNLSGYEPYVFMYEGFGKWHDLIEFLLPFQVEYNQAPIRWRQISGPANGSSLSVGVYPVCYERFNATTNLRDTCCFTVRVQCSSALSSITTGAMQKRTSQQGAGFSVKVLPNPSATSFTLQLNSQSKERISIRVMDVSGRLIETRNGVALNGVLQLGADYHPGTYMVHVQQGAKRTTLKLVKQAR